MEKYSKWRDPGTGIQPFLTPVPPLSETSALAKGVTLVRYGLAVVRAVPVLLCTLLYLATVEGICNFVPPLAGVFTSIWSRLILLMLGAVRFDVKYSASSSRGKADLAKTWKPKAGDVIISNWASWIELLWLAYRFNPIFLLPSPTTDTTPTTTLVTPLSLPSLILWTGHLPPAPSASSTSFADAQKNAKASGRVLVLLPEGTTTNGRGIAKFIDVFSPSQPLTKSTIWLACFRYPAPTPLTPTHTHSLPGSVLVHLLKVLTSFQFPLAITLLSPADAPLATADGLMERCAKGVSEMGRLKRVGFGWEDKKGFLEAVKGGKKKA